MAIYAKNELLLLLLYIISLWCTHLPTYLLIFFVEILDEKRFMELLTSLQYKPLYNINRSEKWGKKIQTAGYNGARTVIRSVQFLSALPVKVHSFQHFLIFPKQVLFTYFGKLKPTVLLEPVCC